MRLLTGAALLALLGPALLAAAPALAYGHDAHAEHSAHEHCEVTIENIGEAALSEGVWLVHHDRDALWGHGLAASEAVEQLAETGDTTAALDVTEGDHQAMAIPAIQPGESASFEFENEPEGAYLSTINRLDDSNDSFVGIANEYLFSERGEPVLEEWELLAFDAGTEENEPRGEAGDDNGTPTENGRITENNPQYGNQPQALLTVRCETVDFTHEEAVAISEAGGDPYASAADDAADTGAHAPGAEHEHCEVAITNLGGAALSAGLALVHHDRDALWAPGLPASAAVELLAETGDPASLSNQTESSYAIPAIAPGARARFSFNNDAGEGVYLSTINKLMDSNDSFVGVSDVRLFTDRNEPVLETFDLLAWDAGTEENEPLGGGFEAGQPDPARGADNVDNGTPTEGGLITENNPQYENQPQARLTLRCEAIALSHAEADALAEAGGDPFAIGDEGADMPSEPDADAAGEMPAEPADDAMDDEMPPEPQPDGETPAEPQPDGDDTAMDDEAASDDDAAPADGDTATAPPVGTGLAPDASGDGGGAPTLMILLALAATVAALAGAALAVRRSRR